MRKQAVIMLVVLIFVALFCLFPRLFTFFTFTSNSDSLFGGGTVSVKQGDKDTAIAGAKHPLPLLNSALHQNGNLTKETETETEKEPATIALEEEEKIMVEQRDAMDTPASRAHTRYCEWNTTLDACREMLSLHLNNKQIWHFYGDSTMKKTIDGLFRQFRQPNVEDRENLSNIQTGSCRRRQAMNLMLQKHAEQPESIMEAKNWTHPDPLKGEGPCHKGLEKHLCTDCRGCISIMRGRSHTDYIEYLCIEFARDVELPTATTKTTQETLGLYLELLNETGSVCVANAGLHDMAIDPAPSPELYASNVRNYIQLLSRGCETIIWHGISAVLGWPDRPQTNILIMEWNTAVYSMIANEHPDVFIIDVMHKSENSAHLDNVHLLDPYYHELSGMYSSFMHDVVHQ
jgi:hypothetical protein